MEAMDLIIRTEWESDGFQSSITLNNVEKLMIEFAKLHVSEALKTITNGFLEDLTVWSGNPYTGEGSECLDQDKINKIYPLKNIK